MEEETVVIQTKLGQLRGLVKHSVLNDKTFYAFLGIPFGKPPLGDLRFKLLPRCLYNTHYVDACTVTRLTYFHSGHLFYVYSTALATQFREFGKGKCHSAGKIAELKEQLRHVIDHSIKNDKRLLQYKDKLFVVNSPWSAIKPRALVSDFGVQCILPATQCVNGHAAIKNLRTTVEVLEAELQNRGVWVMWGGGVILVDLCGRCNSTPDSCYVLIAGTNDLTAEKQNNIHPHLELCFTGKLKTAKVIISNSAPPTRPASCPSSKKGNSSSQCL
ncbi:Cocaine esterase [Homalodisca vitripennis]|nr:Cocaine esterase [Homalodisca vitripennis]